VELLEKMGHQELMGQLERLVLLGINTNQHQIVQSQFQLNQEQQ
jgi:hypothetical protein